jgi:hypothetical protein
MHATYWEDIFKSIPWIFLYLLIAASCSLLISLIFLIPVINKVKRNKQDVLELFTHKQIDKHIDDLSLQNTEVCAVFHCMLRRIHTAILVE